MAEFSKYKAYSVGRLFLHNNRVSGDGVQHSNESIDDERTIYNYHLKRGSPEDVKQRLSELFVLKRSDNIVLGEMIVTLPKDVKPEDERDFFQAVYDFYCKEFGEENIMNAVVHKDEVRPHIHLDFIPVVKGEPQLTGEWAKKEIENWKAEHNGEPPTERVCCKELITLSYLNKMHPRLSKYVEDELGYPTEILNGATINGNKTVLQLKADTLKEEIRKMEVQKENMGKEINAMLSIAKNHGLTENDIGLYPLLQKIEDLDNQITVCKNAMARQGYRWKKDELDRLNAKEYTPAKSVPVNVYEGSLVDVPIPNDALIVVELPCKIPRDSPQKKFIEKDDELKNAVKLAGESEKTIISKQGRKTNRTYMLLKTDNTKQTMEVLLLLEQELRQLSLSGRKLYMDKMESDEYDLARSILVKNQIEALYFVKSEQGEKTKEKDKGLTKEL